MQTLRVAVVGAGLSGLVAAKELLDEGHDVVLFERERRLGGNFSTGAAYARMRLTVSQYFMCFSSFPPPLEQVRRYWTREEYVAYLNAFADHFSVTPRIRFDIEVTKIQRARGRLQVNYAHEGGEAHEDFDAVAICRGAHRVDSPRNIAFKGAETFRGAIHHASDWKGPEAFAGKRVVCIGLGETSADITREISDVAQKCWLSMRSYPLVVPRRLPATRVPGVFDTNDAFSARATHWSKRKYLEASVQGLEGMQAPDDPHMRLISEWTRKAKRGKFLQKNDDFVGNVVSGKITPIISGVAALDGDRVLFEDGSTVEADIVMQCTGFEESSIPASWVDAPDLRDIRSLYKHVFHPSLEQSVAFIGWARPIEGGVPACSEMQSRYFALLCSGKRELPAPAEMEKTIEADAAREREMAAGNLNMSTLVQYTTYMDDLAELIGCSPRLEDFIDEPDLLYRLICGSNIGACYRLTGPHAMPELARKTIMRLPVALEFPRNAKAILHILPAILKDRVSSERVDAIIKIVSERIAGP